ncbi:SixA phosphatase family protein [Blastococcus sp. PRF04-17]|uniref:SixA phosphatase family protein n=1 Tax=Blastococcus sp. PRF04-17 TaxID=2933797 RepID=UPI001FF4ADB3|nr:histidine phosphatase family protein [Blastococcus sp. PRF04-17]UOY01348.1 histidine phosphatase family protein [Blastococcus sp. PRF04-17]
MPPRRLVLIRHAEAGDAPVDVDRPLTQLGERRAEAIGEWLGRAGLAPDRVVVSPAVRAQQTWERAAVALPAGLTGVDERIYDNTVDALLAVLGGLPDEAMTAALVGHNPAVGQLAAVLGDAEGDPAARHDVGSGFPTGGVAVFVLAGTFAALEPGTATLTDFAVPGA